MEDIQSAARSYQNDRDGNGFRNLPIMWEHAFRAGGLPDIHRDPFDRMLIAQCLVEGLTIVSRDKNIAQYSVPVVEA